MMNIAKPPPSQDEEFDRLLRSNVHPAQWKNPAPDNPYNLVVLGGGTAGLARGSAGPAGPQRRWRGSRGAASRTATDVLG